VALAEDCGRREGPRLKLGKRAAPRGRQGVQLFSAIGVWCMPLMDGTWH
jgi:hypothetical protein